MICQSMVDVGFVDLISILVHIASYKQKARSFRSSFCPRDVPHCEPGIHEASMIGEN